MGLVTSIPNFLFQKPKKIIMVGLDCAGKTSILYQLKCENLHTIPTIGLTVETGKYRTFEFTAFDLGGATKIRSLLQPYFEFLDAVIFIFNSHDRNQDRCELAAEELHKISSGMADDKPIMIFANMQDLEGAMNMEEIHKVLRTHDLRQKSWCVQLCSAKTGEGLHEGLGWVNEILCPKK